MYKLHSLFIYVPYVYQIYCGGTKQPRRTVGRFKHRLTSFKYNFATGLLGITNWFILQGVAKKTDLFSAAHCSVTGCLSKVGVDSLESLHTAYICSH